MDVNQSENGSFVGCRGDQSLSPLCIIFVNTIEKGIDGKVLKFADDVKVFRTVETGQYQDAFQSNLDKRFKWSEDWQMKFN